MGRGKHLGARPRATGLTAAGFDHVRLSYHYLDIADIDGYGSILDIDAVLHAPGMPPVRGRRQIEKFQQLRIGVAGAGRHELEHVFGNNRRIAAVGQYFTTDEDGHEGSIEFADLFTIAPNGLIGSQKTYLYLAADPVP
jgi:hypothetical protein